MRRDPVVAVVGCGRMGAGFHVPALATRDDLDLRAVVDPRRDAVTALAERYGVDHALTSVEELPDVGVRAAIVAAPNAHHAPIATALLEHGIDVLIEKPMAPTVIDCERIATAAARTGRRVAVALPFRTSSAARLAREVLEQGWLGQLTSVTAEFSTAHARPAVTDPRRQRDTAGGGALLDLGSHILDLLTWWMGRLDVVDYRDDAAGGVEADCELHLATADGVEVVVELSWTRDLEQLAVFRGEAGSLEVGLGRNHVAWRPEGSGRHVRGTATERARAAGPERLIDLVRRVHDGFLGLDGEHPPVATLDEGTGCVELIERCYAERRRLVWPWEGVAPRPAASTPGTDRPSALRGSRVLVTGATGFIGGRVVEELLGSHGAEVRVLARRSSPTARLLRFPIDLRWGSVRDPDAVTSAVGGCDVVIHCAHDTGSPLRNLLTGVSGTRNVVEAAQRTGVRRFVHLSSAVVYGDTGDGEVSERTPWGRTRDPYALAKRGGERVVESAHEAGLPSVILQPTIVYGPWGKRWTASLVHQLSTGLVPVLDGGRGTCNVAYIDDVVAAILLAATVPSAPGERFLVSGDQAVTWRDFYGAFEEMVDRRATVVVSSDALDAVARAQRRRLRRDLAKRAVSDLRGLLADPEARAALRTLPTVRLAMGLAEDVVGSARWRRLKRDVVGRAVTSRDGQRRPLLYVPGANVVVAQRSWAPVSIDHARRELGFEPAYDLQRGMEATAGYVRWARLIADDRW